MIAFIPHKDIDKNKWDQAIDQSQLPLIYAKSFYLDIVCPGWNALMDDNAVMPLTGKRKYGFDYLFQPAFTQQCGIFSKDKNFHVIRFIEKIPSNYKLAEICLNEYNFFESDFISKRITHHLSLENNYEFLKKNYSQNTIRNIGRAGKENIAIEMSNDLEPVISIFKNSKPVIAEKMKEDDFAKLRLLYSTLCNKKLCTLLTAKSNEKIIAGALFIHSAQRYIFLFSGASEEAKQKGAMSAIIDHFIEKHSGENSILDFEGSMNEALSRFYKSFGSNEIFYPAYRKNNLPFYIRWLK